MKRLAGFVVILISGCSGGSGSSVSSGVAAKWPAQWCQAQPGMSKDQLVGIMGQPTSTSPQVLSWSNDHHQFNAFLEQDGTARQLDTNLASYTEVEKGNLPCKETRSRRSMMAHASPPPKNVLPACELVPQARMSEILGTPVTAEAHGKSKCIYKSSAANGPYAEFEYAPGDGAAGMAGAGFAGNGQPGLTSDLAGVGDQAVAAGPALFIKTGDDLATIVLTGISDRRAAAKKILETAKEKM